MKQKEAIALLDRLVRYAGELDDEEAMSIILQNTLPESPYGWYCANIIFHNVTGNYSAALCNPNSTAVVGFGNTPRSAVMAALQQIKETK